MKDDTFAQLFLGRFVPISIIIWVVFYLIFKVITWATPQLG